MKSNSWLGAWIAEKRPPVPESGDGIHPRTSKIISYERTDWINGRLKPRSPGVYERQFQHGSTAIAYFSLWDGRHWLERQEHPDEFAARFKRSSKQHLLWRGLARDPERQYITYHNAPGVLRDEFDFGGYVAQPEAGTHMVRVIHVAKSICSPDGERLTACGYRAHKDRVLALWGDRGLKIMVRDGIQPELCLSCKRLAFSDC